MRTLTLLGIILLSSAPALAGQNCQTEYLSSEDIALMTSVMPAPATGATTLLAKADSVQILQGLPDYFGRLSDEDLSQIRSVQPQGAKVVHCSTGLSRPR